MQLTKFTHACVRLDDGDRSLVIDPGVFSEVEQALDGATAVLITHEHPDHIDADKVRAALRADPRLQLFAPSSVADGLVEFGDQVVTVAPGEKFEAAGFRVSGQGGQHALIHPAIPVIPNVGFLVEGIYHPGDSFIVPSEPVSTLLLPTNAPWSKAAEVIDFAVAVRAPRAFQIHDSLVTPVYAGMVEGHLGRIAGPHGVRFQHLEPTQTVTI
ncbi:MAG TPA: MBL fold metallo-hydrolase [Jatrophihabitans sp.]|jgi:L-ascorbate metabolism protein UlaG (beta-lactamase superfamily)